MRPKPVRISLLAAALIVWPGVAAAQFPSPPPASPAPAPSAPPPIDQRWPDAQLPRQAPPRPEAEPPAAPAAPTARVRPAPKAATPKAAATKAATPQPPRQATPNFTIACNGVFAKDTNHLKLAVKYDSRNVAYTDVDGPDNSKVKATVLFPRDPKRRLEVLWSNDGARSDIQVISINGQSNWGAPKGLKLGLSIAALEKLNGRPFKLTGFGPDGNASVLDWQGGALASLPGGCKVGARFAADRNASPNVAAVNQELLSNATALKTVKAGVAEILLGY